MAKDVLMIEEREYKGEKKTYWTKVGVAFENRDGSIQVRLSAIPLSGVLQIRERLPPRDAPRREEDPAEDWTR